MQFLETVSRSERASWYRLLGDHQGDVQRWVVSTPQTVAICNDPELAGVAYTDAMRQAMTAAIETAPFKPFLESVASSQLCIMNFLRGGLNFDLRAALAGALQSNHHSTCFMSSQRSRKEGRWVVKEDMYRKMKVRDGSILLVGDVVATGVTVDNGFEVIREYLERTKTPIQGLVFFTIGCHKMEKLLEKYHALFSARFPEYRETHAVYLEGKFRLVDSATRLMIAIQGTDLIKPGAVMAPEFFASQYDTLFAPLERCTIYDAGSRAFDVVEYLDDVIQYWEQVRLLARRGYTLREALKERWPERSFDEGKEAFLASRAEMWQGIEDEFLEELWQRHAGRWDARFEEWARTAEALECVCDDRLHALNSQLSGARPTKEEDA